jgi:hypothetical protein
MAFTIYSSTDSGAPTLNGLTGSLLSVFDAILINGYGSKTPAGWTKPFPTTNSYSTYRLGNGTTSSLFVYDAGSGSQSGAEALMTGWTSISAITAGAVTGSNPYPAYGQHQIGGGARGTAGALVLRKSTVPNNVARTWIAFADSASLYFFTKPADPATFALNKYSGFFFGDFYSLRSGSIDTSRCMIAGRINHSSSTVADDRLDIMTPVAVGINTAVTGHFAANFFGGTSSSVAMGKHGDGSKSVNSSTLLGTVPYLNSCDNSLYISPVFLMDAANSHLRGRMRGFWQILHASGSVSDGQQFTGSGDFPGRTFQVVASTANGGMYLMETSDTLETNVP